MTLVGRPVQIGGKEGTLGLLDCLSEIMTQLFLQNSVLVKL